MINPIHLPRRLVDAVRKRLRRFWRRYKDAGSVFHEIYTTNAWGGDESVSGRGSDSDQTSVIVKEMRGLLAAKGVLSVLDVPCGDHHWMQRVDLHGIDYIGADIVSDLVTSNTNKHGGPAKRFVLLDLMRDPLPRADLILCRDCLVHFSFRDIALAVDNMLRSNATYVLTTTFTDRTSNRDIITGDWRPLNLELAPVCFPKPLLVISEQCTEDNHQFADKALGLWEIAELKRCLATKA